MTKSISFNVSFSKEQIQDILRAHIIDTFGPEDEDFKNATEFESEDFYWDNNDDKNFFTADLLITVPLRKPLKKGK